MKKKFEHLQEYGISVYIIHGNHDHLSGSWITISWPDNVYFFGENAECKEHQTKEGVRVNLYGFSYGKREVYSNQLTEYKKKEEADFHIGILHGQAEGVSGHDPYAPFKVIDLIEKSFDYWAIGHIHQYTRLDSTIFYPGNIQGRHMNECGKKGCLLVHLIEGLDEPNSVIFHRTANVIWEEVVVNIVDLPTVENLQSRLQAIVDSKRRNNIGVLMHITFTGYGELHPFISSEGEVDELIQLLNEDEEREDSFVWVVSYKRNTRGNVDIENLKNNDDF